MLLLFVIAVMMANEVTIQDTLVIQKDGVTLTGSKQIQRDLTGTGKFAGVQSIQSGAGELIVFPAGLIAEGITHVWFASLEADGGDNVSLSLNADMTLPFATLKPGDSTHVAVNKGTTVDPTIYAKSAAGDVALQVVACGT